MRPFLLFIFTLLFLTLSAQNVKGTLSENTNPITYANVMLYSAKDSSLIKFTYSEDNGSFQFDHLTLGEYYIDATFIGLDNYRSAIFTIQNEDIDLGNIIMSQTANQLAEVTVTAKKPLMEVKADKVILNVAGSVLSTGDDALSLLRKAPGVLVDNNENITLLGKSGLIIYIDGKPSPLNAAELTNMLKNMSSNDIESIEIISNPSAKYDAEGDVGIINIILKKNTKKGENKNKILSEREKVRKAVKK